MKVILSIVPLLVSAAEDADLSSLLQLKVDGREKLEAELDLDCKQGPKKCEKTTPAPPSCAGYVCPQGFYQTSTSAVCDGACSTDDCCDAEASCADYTCPRGYYQTSTSALCGSECDKDDCCAKQASCADYTCPSGFTQTSTSAVCGAACDENDCCAQEASCADYTCPRGWYQTSTSAVCGKSCGKNDCCEKEESCANFFCPTGTKRLKGVTCGASDCSADICCETTTMTTTLGERVTCKMFGDPEVETFDGLTDKKMTAWSGGMGYHESQLDVYKTGTYYIVNAPNIHIQAQFQMATTAALTKSMITDIMLGGAALDGNTLKISRGSELDQSKTVRLNGEVISFPHDDAVMTITQSVRRKNGMYVYDYLFKFKNDPSVEIFYTPKFFTNVPEGMLDVSIFMNRRIGVTGMCGNMNKNRNDDATYVLNGVSLVPATESLFNGKVVAQREITHTECDPAIKAQGESWCKNAICGNSQCQPTGENQEQRYESCTFDFCNGGQEVAEANLDFHDEVEKIVEVEASSSSNGDQDWCTWPEFVQVLMGAQC